jgi:quinol monooxygenase YgiN
MGYVVAAHWRAKDGAQDRVAEIIEELTPLSRAEPGNRHYQAQRSTEDPRHFFLYEVYEDEAAYQAHMETEHFVRLAKEEAIPNLLESRERAFFETL